MIESIPGDREGPTEACADPGRRAEPDRRGAPTRPVDSFRLAGRRARVRRAPEREGPFFVDRFDPVVLALVLGVLAFCLIDGFLTLDLLDRNGEEINPIMRFLLRRGHFSFLIGKYILTATGLPFLVMYKNWPLFGTRFRVGYLIPLFFALYLGLLTYQVVLLRS